MADPLATYLRDHLAGSRLAIDLLGTLRDEHEGEPLGQLVVELLVDIRQDRSVVEDLLGRVGSGRFAPIKEAAAYLTEKLSWLKLRRRAGGGLGTLESLETVALGILGKRSLWRALATVAPGDQRLQGINFDDLIRRAEDQHARVDRERLRIARLVFASRAE